MASFMRQRISPAPGDSKAQRPKDRLGRGKTRQNSPKKCQRPRTTGARTSGAALSFRGRPGAGAMKHRRHRYKLDRNDQVICKGLLARKQRYLMIINAQ